MSRFNVRPISTPVAVPLQAPQNKAPNAYRAMGGAGAAPPVAAPAPLVEKKAGRPSKEELRKHKMAMASAGIAMLCANKPTKNKVHAYFESRIATLDEEKR
jgi:hypothetical protein